MPLEIKYSRATRAQTTEASVLREKMGKVKAGILLVDDSIKGNKGEICSSDGARRASYMHAYETLAAKLETEVPIRARGSTPSPPPAEYDSEAMKKVTSLDLYKAGCELAKLPFDFEGHARDEQRLKEVGRSASAARRITNDPGNAVTSSVKVEEADEEKTEPAVKNEE